MNKISRLKKTLKGTGLGLEYSNIIEIEYSLNEYSLGCPLEIEKGYLKLSQGKTPIYYNVNYILEHRPYNYGLSITINDNLKENIILSNPSIEQIMKQITSLLNKND